MRFIFTCGGTAGHINPALAIASRLKETVEPCEILFIGAEGNMEMQLVPREGYEIRPVTITNISRGRSIDAVVHNARTVKNVLLSTRDAKRIISGFRPDAVIGTGGYVCYPVLSAAHELGIPTVLHESNAAPGLTTRILSRSVDRILLGFEGCEDQYPNAERRKITVTGTPVRSAFYNCTKESAKAALGIPAYEPLVLSVWGSLGAEKMNGIVAEMIPMVCDEADFRFIHATGARYYSDFIRGLEARCSGYAGDGVDVRDYIHDMARVMTAADLIICRAGASTLSELTFMGKPAILVPSPNVTNNHQEKNARVLERAGGARVLTEGSFDARTLLNTIEEILSDPDTLRSMGEKMAAMSRNDAAETISGIVMDAAAGNGGN